MAKKLDNIDLDAMRHSCSHVLAQAVLEMFPDAKLGIGPTIEDGFYYDFDLPRTLIPEDLEILEKKMKKIIAQNQSFEKYEKSIAESLEFFKKIGQTYKMELIKDLAETGEKVVSFYENKMPDGKPTFVDLCKGPHVKSTGQIKAFKLEKIAGAYWRGDEKNKMLQRIYGCAFTSREEMDEYLRLKAEAEKRDHRKLGKELELFTISEEIGAGLILWLPKGAILRNQIMNFAYNTYLENGYDPVYTPHLASINLWKRSGHWNFYRESMYDPFGIEGEEYSLKPMNCPFHVTMYKTLNSSYRDLPIRWTEMGTVYRYERSGTLHGLTRVRGFTQDDAHIICTPDQMKAEVEKAVKLTLYILGTFGFKDFEVNLSTRDPQNKDKFLGDDKMWEDAQNALIDVLKNQNLSYVEDAGGAVFYGPKIDIKVEDAIKRKWQLSTIQFDFNLPNRFDLTFTGEDGKEHRPYMIHRALLGSLERFTGVLIEHFGGAFPMWLAPVQAAIIPVSEAQMNFAKELKEKFTGIRVKIYEPLETLSKRIRRAEMQKIPYMLVIGEREMEGKLLSVRSYRTKKQDVLPVEKWLKMAKKEIDEKII